MNGLIEPKVNIGVDRDIYVALHCSKVLLVVCRMLTAAELENRPSAFPWTSVCLTKKCTAALITKTSELKVKLEEVAMGIPLVDYRMDLGENMFVTIDSDTSTVQIRRFWSSPDGPRPTRTGVAMYAHEMASLLTSIGDLHAQMVDGLV